MIATEVHRWLTSDCNGAAAERSKMRLFRTHRPGKAVTMANQANSLSHTKWICKYHIVLTPKE